MFSGSVYGSRLEADHEAMAQQLRQRVGNVLVVLLALGLRNGYPQGNTVAQGLRQGVRTGGGLQHHHV